MDSFIDENDTPAIQEQPSSFLRNLCILTFIWAGISIMVSLAQIPSLYESTAENVQMQATLEQLQTTNPEMSEGLKKVLTIVDKHKMTNWVFSFVGNCFSLMGALMMWNLQKRGFYIYAAAELLPTILSLFFSGFSEIIQALGLMGPFVYGIIIIGVIFVFMIDIIFIAMYGSQLKYMR